MKLAFLGTGAAFSPERYNGAVVVDGHILLDAGAPLLANMNKIGVNPGGIDVVFLTHFHGDHILGLASFLLYRLFEAPTAFSIVGPTGTEERVDELGRFAWGDDWTEFRGGLKIDYHVASSPGSVRGISYEPVRLDHGRRGCTGYRLRVDDLILAYTGDSEATPPLDDLVAGADVAITEATGPGPVVSHTSWEEAAALAARHPQTRFIFNHIYRGELPGAASDLSVVEVTSKRR